MLSFVLQSYFDCVFMAATLIPCRLELNPKFCQSQARPDLQLSAGNVVVLTVTSI